MVPKFVKDETKLPKLVVNRKKEFSYLQGALEDIKQEFNCNIEIVEEGKSKHGTAKQAMPDKVAILKE